MDQFCNYAYHYTAECISLYAKKIWKNIEPTKTFVPPRQTKFLSSVCMRYVGTMIMHYFCFQFTDIVRDFRCVFCFWIFRSTKNSAVAMSILILNEWMKLSSSDVEHLLTTSSRMEREPFKCPSEMHSILVARPHPNCRTHHVEFRIRGDRIVGVHYGDDVQREKTLDGRLQILPTLWIVDVRFRQQHLQSKRLCTGL